MKTIVKILMPDCVVVKQKVEKITESGVIIAQEALEGGSMERFEGEVVAIGEDVGKCFPGDYVSFGRNAFSIKKWNGVEYFYMHESAIHTKQSEVDHDYDHDDLDCDEFFV